MYMYFCVTNHDKGKTYNIYINILQLQLHIIVIAGAEAFAIFSKRVSQINIQTRFMADKNTWPPGQLKNFVPLLLVHYQGHRTPEQVAAMAKLMHSGDIDKFAHKDWGDFNLYPVCKLNNDKNFKSF